MGGRDAQTDSMYGGSFRTRHTSSPQSLFYVPCCLWAVGNGRTCNELIGRKNFSLEISAGYMANREAPCAPRSWGGWFAGPPEWRPSEANCPITRASGMPVSFRL